MTSSPLILFRSRKISNDCTTNVQRSTAAVGHLFEAKRFRVVERVGTPCCGYRIGIRFHAMSELSRIITTMIADAHEVNKRTTVYNISITRAVTVWPGESGLYIMAEFA